MSLDFTINIETTCAFLVFYRIALTPIFQVFSKIIKHLSSRPVRRCSSIYLQMITYWVKANYNPDIVSPIVCTKKSDIMTMLLDTSFEDEINTECHIKISWKGSDIDKLQVILVPSSWVEHCPNSSWNLPDILNWNATFQHYDQDKFNKTTTYRN